MAKLLLQKRLVNILRKYRLTITDLAVLLGSNRSTVFYWVHGKIPLKSRTLNLEERLRFIESKKDRFPVPTSVTQYKRKQYLLDALYGRDDFNRLPRENTSTRGRRT